MSITLLYDPKVRRPACALLQAAAGCSSYDLDLVGFDPQNWLTYPTPGMKQITGTREEWERAAKLSPRDAKD